MRSQVHLIDRLGSATVAAPGEGHVAIQSITIARQTRLSLFQHPPATVTFSSLRLGKKPILAGGCGLKEVCWDHVQSPVTFKILLTDERNRQRVMLTNTINVLPDGDGRRWLDWRIDLSRYQKQTVTLTLVTEADTGDSSSCWAGWADPVLEHDLATPTLPARRDRHRHALLITSDALRADHLGCYGHPLVKTPNLDRLAGDGTLFMHARAQATTTPGSYASMLTGRHAIEHGMSAEWAHVPEGIVNLPGHLASCGYHTLLACSEAELGSKQGGWGTEFRESIPCLAAPMQSGEITARQFVDWLPRRPDKPLFAWLHFFDTHPPCMAPEPFASLYYQGNPEDEMRRYHAEGLDEIHGVESYVYLANGLKGLREGFLDADLLVRLTHTAEVLCGERDIGPDLASHLRSLGPEAHRNIPLPQFGDWLSRQLPGLRAGRPSAELTDWLGSVLPSLKRIEDGILSWLRGVVDFRFALAQYMSTVSYLDHHVGQVRAALEAQGLFEQTTIIFTSPHGELLGESGHYFHHHAVADEVLRVPLIVKPAADAGTRPGQRVAGVFDHIDLMPTLLDALDLPHVPRLTGSSRWQNLQQGLPIPEHDSFASGMHNAMFALTQPPFIYYKAIAPCLLTSQWRYRAGDEALFELTTPMDCTKDLIADKPFFARQMAKRLDDWLARTQGRESQRQTA